MSAIGLDVAILVTGNRGKGKRGTGNRSLGTCRNFKIEDKGKEKGLGSSLRTRCKSKQHGRKV